MLDLRSAHHEHRKADVDEVPVAAVWDAASARVPYAAVAPVVSATMLAFVSVESKSTAETRCH